MGDIFGGNDDSFKGGGTISDSTKGVFKSGNDLSHIPFSGGSPSSVSSTEGHAAQYVTRHSTKGLGFKHTGLLKTKTNTNIGKAIGRKRF